MVAYTIILLKEIQQRILNIAAVIKVLALEKRIIKLKYVNITSF